MRKYPIVDTYSRIELEQAILSDDPILREEAGKVLEWRNRSRYYQTPEWKALRRATFERDNYICQECGKKGKEYTGQGDEAVLIAHHTIERSNGGKDELSNLKTICRKCHHKTTHTDLSMMALMIK